MDIANFSAFRQRLSDLPTADIQAIEQARAHQAQLTKPEGSLGRLEELVMWLAGWQANPLPQLHKSHMLVFAGNHGVVAQGVSAYPQAVTAQMVQNFKQGGAAVNQLCKLHGIGFSVVPLNLEQPTRDFTKAAAMEEAECCDAIAKGMESVPQDIDLLLLGEMGIGNTTAATAMLCAMLDIHPKQVVGRGTGVNDAQLQRKQEVIAQGISRHRALLQDPLQVLRCLGGYEIAALIGAILEARLRRIPVVLDGLMVTTAALVLHGLDQQALVHTVAGHESAEPAHRYVLHHLQMEPLLRLNMRLGEGSGAATAYGLLRAALATHHGMASFSGAGVSEKQSAG